MTYGRIYGWSLWYNTDPDKMSLFLFLFFTFNFGSTLIFLFVSSSDCFNYFAGFSVSLLCLSFWDVLNPFRNSTEWGLRLLVNLWTSVVNISWLCDKVHTVKVSFQWPHCSRSVTVLKKIQIEITICMCL